MFVAKRKLHTNPSYLVDFLNPWFKPPLSQGLLWYKVYIYSKSIPQKTGTNLDSKIRFCFISCCQIRPPNCTIRPPKNVVRNAAKHTVKLATDFASSTTELEHPETQFWVTFTAFYIEKITFKKFKILNAQFPIKKLLHLAF